MMKFDLFVVLLTVVSVQETECDEVDCSLHEYPSKTQCSVRGDVYFFNSYQGIYCDHPYTCCDNGNGCCFDGNSSTIFTEAELLGLILNATAMFVVGIMTLVICGSTHCNNKEDESDLFSGDES